MSDPGPDPQSVATPGQPPSQRPCQAWTDQIVGKPLPIDKVTGNPAVSEFQLAVAFQVASELLWRWSGRRYGTCDVTVRPIRRHRGALDMAMNWPWLSAYLSDASWGLWPRFWLLPLVCGGCSDSEHCEHRHTLDLAKKPVVSVNQVLIDGVVLDPSAYRVDNWGQLVRTDGSSWPEYQDLLADDTENNTWSVSYTFGNPPPTAGVVAAGQLARELALEMVGMDCALPRRVQSINRQGVQIQFINLDELLSKGMTGLTFVDYFIASVNPDGLKSRAHIYRPDARRRTSRTNT